MKDNNDTSANFSFGSLLSSILPTIGTVVGQLLNANNSLRGGLVIYEFTPKSHNGTDEECSAAFGVEDGHYFLFNKSMNKENKISLATPGQGTLEPETLSIPGRGEWDVTELFANNANKGNSVLEITGGASSSACGNATQGVGISASASHIPVDDDKEYKIGSYLNAKLTRDSVEITSSGATIQKINCLTIKGLGDTTIRMTNIDAKMYPNSSGNGVLVHLPEPLPAGDKVNLQVEVMVSSGNLLECQGKYQGQVKMISASRWDIIQNAKRLNS